MRRLLAIIVTVLLAIYGQSLAIKREYPLDAILLWWAAAVAAVLVARLTPDSDNRLTRWRSYAIKPFLSQEPTHHLRGGLFFGMAAIIGFVVSILFWQERYPIVLMVIWVTSLACIIIGAKMIGPTSTVKVTSPDSRQLWESLALVVVLLIGFFLRVYQFDSLNSGLYLDEADNCLEAMRLYTLPDYLPFTPVSNGHPTLFLYGLGMAFQVAGHSIEVMRLFVAFIGVLTLAAFYPLARLLFSRHVSLILVFLFAVSHWHINFSRIGFEGILTPLALIVSVFWLLKAVQTTRLHHFALAGLAIGVALHTYLPSRMAPVLAIAIIVFNLASESSGRRQRLVGAGLALAVALLAFAPLLAHFLNHANDFYNRANQAAVFLDIERARSLQPLWDNIRQTALMFNWQGDPRPRHNLPHQPMLDWISAVLFGLGIFIVLFKAKYLRQYLVLMWLALMSVPGVLSLADSNPHALRTIGNIPAVFLVVGFSLEMFGRAWSDGVMIGRRVRIGALVIALGVAGWLNYDLVFHLRPENRAVYYDFDPAQTAAGYYIRERASLGERVYISPVLVNHATVRFIPAGWPYERLDLNRHIPLQDDIPADVTYVLELAHQSLLRQLSEYYPGGQSEVRRDRYGQPMFSIFKVSPDEVLATRGLRGRLMAGLVGDAPPTEMPASAIDFNWSGDAPLPAPFRGEWSGSLLAPAFGEYRLALESTGNAALTLDGKTLIPATPGRREVIMSLPGGFHSIGISLTQALPEGKLRLTWTPPGNPEQVILTSNLLTIPAGDNGMLGRYFRNNNWDGPPVLVRLDTLLGAHDFVPAPFSIEWEGQIYVPRSGTYALGTNSDDGSQVWVDGFLAVDNGGHHGDRYVENRLMLAEGLHPLRIRYFQDDGGRKFELWWTPPGGQKETVPPGYLFPPGRQPDPTRLARLSAPVTTPRPAAQLLEQLVRLSVNSVGILGGPGMFQEPRSVAVASSGDVFVADTGSRQVHRLDQGGRLLRSWGRPGEGEGEFLEPVAVVVDRQGFVLVLDAVKGDIQRFTPEGRFISRFPAGPGPYRPRGMSIDSEDNLYIADTGSNRVVKLTLAGLYLETISGANAKGLEQPTSAATDAYGNIWVAEPDAGRITILRSDGTPLSVAPVPRAGTVRSPHLVAAHGGVFYTDTESGELVLYSSDGVMVRRFGQAGSAQGDMLLPTSVALDAQGNLYVAESGNRRIQKFAVTRQ
jgi:sugar lactone lactonase YvrE/4-amino-4-deoxy-L-arabinose transferase-like glycosyltransferase